MKNAIRSATLLICLSFLCSCGAWYGYAGKRYDTKQEALKAQKGELDDVIRNIKPKDGIRFNNALLILPSREAIEKRGFSGNLDLSSEVVDYLATTVEATNQCIADVLEKSNLFEDVEVRRALYPGVSAYENFTKFDATIYVKLTGNGKYSLMMVTPKSTKENLVFLENKIPQKLAGYQFWLQNIEKTIEQDKQNADATSSTLKDQMMYEQRMSGDDNDSDNGELTKGLYNENEVQDQKPYTYYVSFNPFSYPNLHDTDLGQDEIVAILHLPDRREDAKENDTHIGTIYGMVYHNPLFEIHTAEGVSQNAMDALATLFTANGFRVMKYPGMNTAPANCKARFVITGQVNKLWTKCFHSAEAEVDFDINIHDTKLNKTIWSGKIEGYELEDPKKILGLTGFLNKVLGDAINKVWNDKSMRASFGSLAKEEASKEKVEELEMAVKDSPKDAKELLRLGAAYLEMKEFQNAIDTLRKSIEFEPNNPRTHFCLGFAYLGVGNKEASLEQYDILKSLDENYAKKLFQQIYK